MAWTSSEFNFDGYIYLYKTINDKESITQFECEGDLAAWLTYQYFKKCRAYRNVEGFSKKEIDILSIYSSYICTGKGMKSRRKKHKTLQELFPKFFTDKEEVRKYINDYKEKWW